MSIVTCHFSGVNHNMEHIDVPNINDINIWLECGRRDSHEIGCVLLVSVFMFFPLMLNLAKSGYVSSALSFIQKWTEPASCRSRNCSGLHAI